MFPSVVTATHMHHLLWEGQNGLQSTPDNLHLGCSYHLYSSHRFLSTWGVVMLVTPQVERKKKEPERQSHKNARTYLLFSPFHHEPDGTYSSLIVQLEAVITEVPTVQVLWLRAVPR